MEYKHIHTQSGHMTSSSQCGCAKWLDTNQHRHSCTTGRPLGLTPSLSLLIMCQKVTAKDNSWIRELYKLHFLSLLLVNIRLLSESVSLRVTEVHAALSLLSHSLGCFVSVSWNVNIAWFLWSVRVEKYSCGLISVQTNGYPTDICCTHSVLADISTTHLWLMWNVGFSEKYW